MQDTHKIYLAFNKIYKARYTKIYPAFYKSQHRGESLIPVETLQSKADIWLITTSFKISLGCYL